MTRMLTIAEVAALYACSPNLVEDLAVEGRIPSVGENSDRRIPLATLNRQLRQVDRLRINGVVLPVATPR